MPPAVLPSVATSTASATFAGWSCRYANSAASEGSGTSVAAAKLAARRNTSGAAESTMLNSARFEHQLPRENPEGAGLRRGSRIAARARARAVEAPGQPPAPQARGPAARILVQAARRLQQDGGPAARAPAQGRDRRERGQPRAGRGARGAALALPRGDRDAGHHAADQDRGGGGARR